MNDMDESQAPWVIRNCLGKFFQQLAFVDRRWICVDSCASYQRESKNKSSVPWIPSDLLRVSTKQANDYLCAVKLITSHKVHQNTLCINQKA